MSDKQAHVICDSERFPLFSTAGAMACAKNIVDKFGRDEYGYRFMEIGYVADDLETVAILAYWNGMRKAEKAIEALSGSGVPIEALWDDEYNQCDECHRFVRVKPDSYRWTPRYVFMEGYTICEDCVRDKMIDEYIEMLVNALDRCGDWVLNSILTSADLIGKGFVQWSTGHEIGFYSRDERKDIARYLQKKCVKAFLFSCSAQEQFTTRYSVWIKLEDGQEAPPIPQNFAYAAWLPMELQ